MLFLKMKWTILFKLLKGYALIISGVDHFKNGDTMCTRGACLYHSNE